MKIAITGGAGFIGSHLADALLTEGHEVRVIDNLSGGNYTPKAAKLIKLDINSRDLKKHLEGCETVFHFAADPDVKGSAEKPEPSFRNNVLGTFNVLEACRSAGIKNLVFASTSTVYGENVPVPTQETIACAPISNYAASKLAGEAYCQSYSSTYGLRVTILRYANVFGERSARGVMRDFYLKLKKTPDRLEILGDGNQEKSYIYISDAITATITAWKKQNANCGVYNVGGNGKNTVVAIANLVSREMKLKPELVFTGGKRGWAGDVPVMQLATTKLEKLGWKEKIGLENGLTKFIAWLKTQP